MQKESVSEEDISALLAAVRDNGDIDAFETVFRHFAPRIRAYMLRLVKDARLAEELVQETMMTVWRKPRISSAVLGAGWRWWSTRRGILPRICISRSKTA